MTNASDKKPLIRVERLYQLFGDSPKKHIHLVHEGKTKDEILKETGHTLGLKDINLEINKGETFVIMGLSGSGKSTLIRHFNRLIEPTEGRILIDDDQDVLKLSAKELQHLRRKRMSMVFQRFGLMPHRNVLENTAYGLSVQGVKRSERNAKAKEWLKTVGLEGYEKQFPSQLSGGQQQRVGLARAFCTDADVLLMDEAFSALDPLIRSEMQDQLVELQETLNKTIIFITHDLDEALRLGDRIAILKDGELIQVGTPEKILLEPATDYVEAFVKDVNRARALTVDTVMKPAKHRITEESIAGALAQMKKMPEDYGYYFNDEGYQGVILQETLEAAAKDGQTGNVNEALMEDVENISPDDILETVIPETLNTDYPLPVVDDKGKLKGQLSQSSVADVLSNP
ncbi:glycine betaine/L-proline ABC transporter ATP-binding protein [Leucothrix sargassi]|nr:glycine betaine/L-proline ABC transporter ATP-binding protein [Leucothrix sargassi]